MSDVWSPAQYERFRSERSKPFHDLLGGVAARPSMRVVDLGCGTGALTAEMHARLGAKETLGIDRSPAMLAGGAREAAPGLRFETGDIADFHDDGAWDLVFSNAALHWLPDHPALFARLARALAPGGQLAVQMPASFDSPSHVVAAEIAAEAPFAEALGGGGSPAAILPVEVYAKLLHDLGFETQEVRLVVYPHVLGSRDDVVEWVRGTLLTAYESRLSKELFAAFLARYRARLMERLPDERPFFFPFKRVLMWARRPA